MFSQLFADIPTKLWSKLRFDCTMERSFFFFFFDKEETEVVQADVTAKRNSLLETFCDFRRTKWDFF